MPEVNRLGEYVGGRGESQVHINDVTLLQQSGGIVFVDDDRVVYQVCDEHGCRLVIQNIRNDLATSVVQPQRGADTIYGGGGKWAAWLGGFGLYDSDGRHLPDAALPEPRQCSMMRADGAYAFKPVYQSAGPWHVREASGSEWKLSDEECIYINLLGQRRACWMDQRGSLHAVGMPTPKTLTQTFWWLRVLHVRDEWWVMYQEGTHSRLICHPFDDPSRGYVLQGAGMNAFAPDWVVLPNGLVRVVWATSQGEWVGQVATKTLDVAHDPRVALGVVDPPVDEKPPVCAIAYPKNDRDGICGTCTNLKAAHALKAEEPVAELIPNRFEVVQRIADEHPHLLQRNDDASIKEFYHRAAWALHQDDPKFGMLSKSGGESGHDIEGVGRVAHDAIAYEGVDPIVDIISGALGISKNKDGSIRSQRTGPMRGVARAAWQYVEQRRASNKWVKPTPFGGVVNPPPTDPPVDTDLVRRVQALEERADRTQREHSAALDQIRESIRNVGGLTGDDVAAIVREKLATLRVEVDAKEAGPEIKLLGQRINLRHDHAIDVSIMLDGQRVGHALTDARVVADDRDLDQ